MMTVKELIKRLNKENLDAYIVIPDSEYPEYYSIDVIETGRLYLYGSNEYGSVFKEHSELYPANHDVVILKWKRKKYEN